VNSVSCLCLFYLCIVLLALLLTVWFKLLTCSTIFLCRCGPTRVMASSFTRFLDHTQRLTAVGRTPLDEWSARHRDLELTTHSTHNRQTSMPLVGFEPTISERERPQTYALDRAATGTGMLNKYNVIFYLTIRINWLPQWIYTYVMNNNSVPLSKHIPLY
jgi:hypothetical protein